MPRGPVERFTQKKKKEKKKKYCFFTSQTYISSLTRLGLAMEKVHDPAPAKKTEKEGNDESESSQTTDGESRTEAWGPERNAFARLKRHWSASRCL